MKLPRSTATRLAAALFWFGLSTLQAEPPPKAAAHVREEPLLPMPEGVIASTVRISPDGKRVAGVIARGDAQIVFTNREQSAAYVAVMKDSIHFSPDSKRVAYCAKLGPKAFVVVDGVEYPEFGASGVGFPLFSADSKHFLYTATRPEGKACVVVDGKAGETYEAIMKGGPLFGPAGKRFVYVAKVDQSYRVVIDGVAGPMYRNIDAITFSADGQHVAYVGMSTATTFLVLDGVERAKVENIVRDSLAFDSPARLHILAITGAGLISRIEVDLLQLGGVRIERFRDGVD